MTKQNNYGLTGLKDPAAPVSTSQAGDCSGTSLNPIGRIESIDLLRGLIMIIMALDHTREFFHFDSFLYSPTDLEHTTAPIFFTRWITHLCAPVFIFLSGTSAYMVAQRKSKRETAFFLLSRGLWLIVLQFTVVRFAWNLDVSFQYNAHTILSLIGCCMIMMAALIYLPINALLILGLTIVAGHNLLDGISFESNTFQHLVWSFLHKPGAYSLGGGYVFNFAYPFIPWIGLMMLGYCAGRIYQYGYNIRERRELIFLSGGLCLFTFVVIRAINIYGDPSQWSIGTNGVMTFLSFINLSKYPPSLLYLCATMGISFIILSVFEGQQSGWLRPVSIFGQVALFYYVMHIFLIHILSMVAIVVDGLPWFATVYHGPVTEGSPLLVGTYGFSLPVVYAVWAIVVITLYPVCVAWNNFKIRNKRKWWVSYA